MLSKIHILGMWEWVCMGIWRGALPHKWCYVDDFFIFSSRILWSSKSRDVNSNFIAKPCQIKKGIWFLLGGRPSQFHAMHLMLYYLLGVFLTSRIVFSRSKLISRYLAIFTIFWINSRCRMQIMLRKIVKFGIKY